jgi:hypothetical protein
MMWELSLGEPLGSPSDNGLLIRADLAISMIFRSANMWDVNMRNAVYTWRKDQEESPRS